jgi:hypothetical protein
MYKLGIVFVAAFADVAALNAAHPCHGQFEVDEDEMPWTKSTLDAASSSKDSLMPVVIQAQGDHWIQRSRDPLTNPMPRVVLPAKELAAATTNQAGVRGCLARKQLAANDPLRV